MTIRMQMPMPVRVLLILDSSANGTLPTNVIAHHLGLKVPNSNVRMALSLLRKEGFVRKLPSVLRFARYQITEAGKATLG